MKDKPKITWNDLCKLYKRRDEEHAKAWKAKTKVNLPKDRPVT